MDRNLGAISADPHAARIEDTYGYYFQFGRPNPLKGYYGIARDMKECEDEMQGPISHPNTFYGMGSKTCEWYNTGSALPRFIANLWGNKLHMFATYEQPGFDPYPNSLPLYEDVKTIYDPCPPGFMVPPEMAWECCDPQEFSYVDGGVLIPTASGDSFYPFAGYISALNEDEKSDVSNVGYFGYNGYERRHGREVFRIANVYTSATGANGDEDFRWNCFGAKYMGVWVNYDIEDGWHFDAKANHIRQYGRSVRCMRIPK